MKRLLRLRWGSMLARFARLLYRYPAILCLLPYGVFFPLLDSRGLYEYGDANFPLNPFWVDYILPWSGAASAGADNTFIGVPRLAYHLGINLLIATFHNLQVAQWLWYSSMAALGLIGAFLLARRLGAGFFAVPLAIFYSLNLWSYDRVAQGPIFLSYQAMPLAIYFFVRYLRRPAISTALYFGCSLLLVIPALQISYLAAAICLFVAVRAIALRGVRVIPALAGLAVAVVAANAFYIFSMLADIRLNAGGNIALVNQRFNMGVFEHYAANVSVLGTLALQSFYYTSVQRQMEIVRVGVALIPLLLAALLALMRPPRLRSKFYAGLALALLGIWLVDGIVLAPDQYTWFHFFVPGLRSFVEPDYFSPVYIFGAFVMFATAVRLGARAYGGWWRAAFWLMALSGILPFLPIFGPASGLPRASQPQQYRDFSHSTVLGKTLWIPPERGVGYRWAPYVINGFTSLNSPSDAIGPSMAEAVSRGTERVQDRLADGFVAGQLRTVERLAPLMGVGTIAIAADSLDPDGQWPNHDVVGALRTFDALRRSGFIARAHNRSQDLVHLVTGTTRPPLPELGLYDVPVPVGGFSAFMWRIARDDGGRYVPSAVDGGAGRPPAAPATLQRAIAASRFRRDPDCSGRLQATAPRAGALVLGPVPEQRCYAVDLPSLRGVAALQLALLARPAGIADLQIVFHRKDGDVTNVDPTLPAQEVPAGTVSATAVAVVPANASLTIGGIAMRTIRRASAPLAPAQTCRASNGSASEQNPLEYTLRADLRGRCTLVFRQSFAPIWTLDASGAKVAIGPHLQIDGFANGWIVQGSGPVTLRVVNRAIYPYAGGLALTLLCLLLAAGYAIRDRMRWAARRTNRVPSPA